MIQTLRKKFVIITMGLVSIVLLAVVLCVGLYFSSTFRQESYRVLEMAIERPYGVKPPNIQIGGPAGGNVPDNFRTDPVFILLVDSNNRVTLTWSERIDVDQRELQEIATAALATRKERGDISQANMHLRFLIQRNGNDTKIAFMPLSFEQKQLKSIVLITSLATIGAFFVFLVASIMLARWALHPVESAWNQQKRFVADASHELRTPLTIILANMGILKSHPQDTIASQSTWVENTEAEAHRMKTLVDDLLFLAKSNDSSVPTVFSSVNLSNTVLTSALSFDAIAFEQGISIDYTQITPDIHIMGNAPLLKQLMGILLDNALKYCTPQSCITLRLIATSSQTEISVHNTGIPIPRENLALLFERFYRVDDSRAKEGYGLGLSIAKAITDQHHGKIQAHSDIGGTTFTVCFPRA